LPVRAAVSRTINAVAPAGRISIVRLTAPDPNHIRIRWCNRDRSDRKRALLIEDRVERDTVIAGFENAAVREPHIKNRRVPRIDRDVGNPSAHHRRTDPAYFEIFE